MVAGAEFKLMLAGTLTGLVFLSRRNPDFNTRLCISQTHTIYVFYFMVKLLGNLHLLIPSG